MYYVQWENLKIQLTLDNSNLQGKLRKVNLSYGEVELSGDGIPADTTYHMTRFDTFYVPLNTRNLKKVTQRTVRHFKTTVLLIFSKTDWKYPFSVME